MPARRNSRNGSKTSKASIYSKIKAAKAVNLRAEGYSFPEIAKQLGYNSRQAAYDAVVRALTAILREPVEHLITLDLERLDKLWQINYLNAQSGDIQALSGCMKIMDRRAKLLGMDAVPKAPPKEAESALNIAMEIKAALTDIMETVPGVTDPPME